jgi:bifunctional non-homologous end joining protein LigD
MPLKEYRQKRHFAKTPEPAGKARRQPLGRQKALQFVVQKHAATRLHYDLRLEWEGVLKSWAVPKGPSLDPKEKRLAVEVEDHPLEYAKFEGEIPKGEYGGGEVILWDRGTWTPEKDPAQGFRQGKLEFALDGQKLTGRWVLVRTRGRQSSDKPSWLLIKRTDDAARPQAEFDVTAAEPASVKSGKRLTIDKETNTSPKPQHTNPKRKRRKRSANVGPLQAPPERIELQLATLASDAPTGKEWIHEVKFDGYRMLCWLDRGKATLITRNQQDWTHRYRVIAEAVARLPVESAVLDGEVVALLPSGLSSFQALQNTARNGAAGTLAYYAFDLLFLDGEDLRKLPLIERKSRLRALLDSAPQPAIRFSEHFETSGPKFLRQCCRLGLEGAISKRRDRPYLAGRSEDWRKAKCLLREELVIGGYTLSTAMKRGIGALLVGYFEEDELIYAGRVGTGFSEQTMLDLRVRLEQLKQGECPFASIPARERGREVRWVLPQLVAEVEFTAWTDGGILRHPSFQGLREDKPAAGVARPASLPTKENGTMNGEKRASKRVEGKARKPKSRLPIPQFKFEFTSPDRVLYADMGLTKLGLASYYSEIADWILPHLVDRPLSLVRCPEGQRAGKCFYQKHVRKGTPAALGRVTIAESDGADDYAYVKDLEGLLALVQMNVLEIHPWGSRRDNVERPDRLIFDLDPDPSVPWQRVIDAAAEVRELLEAHELVSFLKTTGGKGLHLVVPLAPRRHDWTFAKAFCKSLAEELVTRAPERYTANMSKAARRGKIFVDYLRNDRGATAIAAYSTRAKPGATVSVPLAWEELAAGIRSDQFSVANVPARLASLRRDPWKGIEQVKQTLRT